MNSSINPCDPFYPGLKPISEPETKIVTKLFVFNIKMVINFQKGENIIRIPYKDCNNL